MTFHHLDRAAAVHIPDVGPEIKHVAIVSLGIDIRNFLCLILCNDVDNFGLDVAPDSDVAALDQDVGIRNVGAPGIQELEVKILLGHLTDPVIVGQNDIGEVKSRRAVFLLRRDLREQQ